MTATVYKWEFVPEFLQGVREMITEVREPLFHFTDRGAAESMGERGHLWLTRADCFLDEREIHHGIDILLTAVAELGGDLGDALHRAIDESVRLALRNAFVLSLTEQQDNAFLMEHYGQNVVRFEPTFPMILNAAAFNIKNGLNMQVVYEIYRVMQGKVIYDVEAQHELARRVARALLDLNGMTIEDAKQRDSLSMRMSDFLLTAKFGAGVSAYRLFSPPVLSRMYAITPLLGLAGADSISVNLSPGVAVNGMPTSAVIGCPILMSRPLTKVS